MDIENADQLRAYLIQRRQVTPDERLEIRPLTGGVSNRTVWVQRPNGEAWVLKQALEKLRVPVDWYCSPQRVHREALGIRWLEQLAPKGCIAPLVFEDTEHHIIAMQAVPHPHENWKTRLLQGGIQSEGVQQFAKILAAIHRNSYHRREEIARVFHDRSFFEQLRLEPFYEYPASFLPQAALFLLPLIQDTRKIQAALVHGDFSPKNILVRNNRLILLDHEVIHFGDPAFDIGFAMTHFLSKAHALPGHRQAFFQAAQCFWQVYWDSTERMIDTALETRAVRHTLGCLLARAAGRSTMDYFTEEHKTVQTNLSLELMQSPPMRMPDVINDFINGLNNYEPNSGPQSL